MITVTEKIRTWADAARFVRDCETDFHSRIAATAAHIVQDDRLSCITLSGPTCSGKTTTAAILTEAITAAGKRAVVLSIDDFFKERVTPKSTEHKADYDSVKALDLELFSACARQMLCGENTRLPRFDFVSGKRSEWSDYLHAPENIIVFEGIQAVYPEVVSILHAYPCTSIFISVTDSIAIGDTVFSPEEIRLSRRIVRDHKFRSATPEFTLYIWEGVRENEETNIFPYMHTCAHFVNSAMPYEPFMIAPYLIPLLESVPCGSPYFQKAEALLVKYRQIGTSNISAEFLPENSLYHEFLG